MSQNQKTLEEIRIAGLRALDQALGPADLIRFLQQFEHGHGDYTEDRRRTRHGSGPSGKSARRCHPARSALDCGAFRRFVLRAARESRIRAEPMWPKHSCFGLAEAFLLRPPYRRLPGGRTAGFQPARNTYERSTITGT